MSKSVLLAWNGGTTGKLFNYSGQFTNTVKTSYGVGVSLADGISDDGSNTLWTHRQGNVGPYKHRLQSGRITSLIKSSYAVNSGFAITYTGANTIGLSVQSFSINAQITLISGSFSSTIKTSIKNGVLPYPSNIYFIPDISCEGSNMLLIDAYKSLLYSGIISSIMKTSHSQPNMDGISWDSDSGYIIYGNEATPGKLIAVIGRFTSSIATSAGLGWVGSNFIGGIEHVPIVERLVEGNLDIKVTAFPLTSNIFI